MKVWIPVICILLCNVSSVFLQGTSDVLNALQVMTDINAANCGPGGTQNFIDVLPNYSLWENNTRIARMTADYMNRIISQNNGKVESLEDQDYYNYIQNNIIGQTSIFASSITLVPGLHPKYRLFAPYAYRKNNEIVGEDISTGYDYTDPTTLWWDGPSRKTYRNIPEVTIKTKMQGSTNVETESTLVVRREDCEWTKPYFDCGGGNVWLTTHLCPILYKNSTRTYTFMGVGYFDMNLSDKDINQCGAPEPADIWGNAFKGTDKCPSNSECRFKPNSGLIRGGYQCVCRKGYYSKNGVMEGADIEKAYSQHQSLSEFDCQPCPRGCQQCSSEKKCLWPPGHGHNAPYDKYGYQDKGNWNIYAHESQDTYAPTSDRYGYQDRGYYME